MRAKIVLACEREPSNAVVATRLGVGTHTIGKWRKRFIADRIEGLYDEMRSGRPRTVEDEAVSEATGAEWRYMRVNQTEFDSSGATALADLADGH